MSDDQFTKIAVSLLTGVKDLVDWGVEGGHTTEEQLRLTVSARQAKAKELVGAGVSQRQAAKLLGVSHTQIRKDVDAAPRAFPQARCILRHDEFGNSWAENRCFLSRTARRVFAIRK